MPMPTPTHERIINNLIRAKPALTAAAMTFLLLVASLLALILPCPIHSY